MSCCGKSHQNHDHDHHHSNDKAQPKAPSRIHRQMTIETILSMFPHKAQKLSQEITNAGLHCVGCQAATWETLEAGMYGHGMNDEQINRLVDRLNALLEEETDLSTITITPRAAKKYLEILEDEGKQGWGLRFAERMAGCNGFEYALDYSEKALHTDETFESLGIEIHIDKGMVNRLLGSEIDFIDGLHGSGFKISNPNVRSSCGCGTSHGY
jgi:iron-sulfur cluster assembly protein